jgi:hypothetical protein
VSSLRLGLSQAQAALPWAQGDFKWCFHK